MENRKKTVRIFSRIALLLVGVFVVPRCLKSCTAKVYKNSHEEIDLDDFEPEIIPKEKESDHADQY